MAEEVETTDVTEGPEIEDPAAVLAALERAKADAKKFREQLAALEVERDAIGKQLEELKNVDVAEEWKGKYKNSEVRQALAGKGIKDADRVMKFMDLDSVSFDDDGKLSGLDAAVDSVKKELPELFDPKRRVGGGADLFTQGEVKKALSTTELQLEHLRNGK